jgi:hypothetical protein
VLLLRKNLPELAVHSNYSIRERWQPKRGGESPTRTIMAFTGAVSQAMDSLPTTVYCDVVTLLSMWHGYEGR